MLNRKTILMMLVALSLNACATADKFGSDVRGIFAGDSDRTGKVVYADENSTSDEASGSVVVTSAAVDDLGTYNKLASKYAGDSSVELFSLDNPGQPLNNTTTNPDGVTTYSLEGGNAGKISSTDPSVTVFPFSDDMYTTGVRHNPRAGTPRGPADNLTPELPMGAGAYRGADDVAMFTGNPNTVYFEHGSSALNATARQVIASAARNYGGSVHVAAHASQRAQTNDPVERGILNIQMSMKRAMAVTKQLIRDGVPPEAIKTTAYGDAQPAVPETDRQAEAKNRRVQILTGAQ